MFPQRLLVLLSLWCQKRFLPSHCVPFSQRTALYGGRTFVTLHTGLARPLSYVFVQMTRKGSVIKARARKQKPALFAFFDNPIRKLQVIGKKPIVFHFFALYILYLNLVIFNLNISAAPTAGSRALSGVLFGCAAWDECRSGFCVSRSCGLRFHVWSWCSTGPRNGCLRNTGERVNL